MSGVLINKISLVIVACNEERNIARVLAAAQPIASEIIVVDSGSKDQTKEIAKSFGATVVYQDWLGYAAQKNYAVSLAKNDWVLSLDADEVMTPDLVSEIKLLMQTSKINDFAGYKIPRILYIGNTAVRRGGFYPDAQLRLFRKSKGRFNERAVHERVFVEGQVGNLKNAMQHFSYANLDEFSLAMEKYARLSAQHFSHTNYSFWQISVLNELLHPLWTFFFRFVIRSGFLDGSLGLKLNLIYSNYVRKKIHYLRAARAKQC